MLKNRTTQLVVVLGLIAAVVGIGLAYSYLKPTEEASEPISSIPIDENVDTNEAAEQNDDGSEDSEQSGGTVKFEIIQSESTARFTLGEILRGADNDVVGVTDQVAGEIIINFDDPSASQIGTILVNARTLATDSSFRDRAIKNRILITNTYEFITFTPTSVTGWPDAAVVGDTIGLEIIGDLTILDTTLEVTFVVTIVAVSETRMEGSGSTVVKWVDYGITIPEVQAVTQVDDEVLLEIEFVAEAVE